MRNEEYMRSRRIEFNCRIALSAFMMVCCWGLLSIATAAQTQSGPPAQHRRHSTHRSKLRTN